MNMDDNPTMTHVRQADLDALRRLIRSGLYDDINDAAQRLVDNAEQLPNPNETPIGPDGLPAFHDPSTIDMSWLNLVTQIRRWAISTAVNATSHDWHSAPFTTADTLVTYVLTGERSPDADRVPNVRTDEDYDPVGTELNWRHWRATRPRCVICGEPVDTGLTGAVQEPNGWAHKICVARRDAQLTETSGDYPRRGDVPNPTTAEIRTETTTQGGGDYPRRDDITWTSAPDPTTAHLTGGAAERVGDARGGPRDPPLSRSQDPL